MRASKLAMRRGGNCPNMVEVLQQLLAVDHAPPDTAVLCAVLPSKGSAATKTIGSSLGPNVDMRSCIYREDHVEAASSFIIRSAATKSRTIVNHNDLPEMTVAEFVAQADEIGHRAKWYHFEVGTILCSTIGESRLRLIGSYP